MSQEGLGPSKAGGLSRKDTAHFLERRDAFSLFMLSTSRGKVLPEQKRSAQTAFPSHRPLQLHLSFISLAHWQTVFLTHPTCSFLSSSSACW